MRSLIVCLFAAIALNVVQLLPAASQHGRDGVEDRKAARAGSLKTSRASIGFRSSISSMAQGAANLVLTASGTVADAATSTYDAASEAPARMGNQLQQNIAYLFDRQPLLLGATGFALDFSWLHVDTFDANGFPRHQRGVSVEPGIYFLGLPWQSRRGSSFIWGVWHDAKHVADHIAKQRGYLAYQGTGKPANA